MHLQHRIMYLNSFSSQKMNFISEKDVEAAKKKREEEWKKAREEGREIRTLNTY